MRLRPIDVFCIGILLPLVAVAAAATSLPDTDGNNTVSVPLQVSSDSDVAICDPAWGGFISADGSAGRTLANVGELVQLLVTSIQTDPSPFSGTGNFTVNYNPTQFAFVTDDANGGACDISVPGVVTCLQNGLENNAAPDGKSDGFYFTVTGHGNLTALVTVIINDDAGNPLIGASRPYFLCVPAPAAFLSAFNFTVLAGSAVTNTGNSVITENVGVSPTAAVTGFPPGVVINGSIHAADGEAAAAQAVVADVYSTLNMQECTSDMSGNDLGGFVLKSGVYCFSSTAALTGTLTLNGTGSCTAVFVFKVGSALTTADSSMVLAIENAQAMNVFWLVGSSATLGAESTFLGTILANTAITVGSGANITGRLLARTAAVTLIDDVVTAPTISEFCSTACPPDVLICLGGSCDLQNLTNVYGPAEFDITCPEFSGELLCFGTTCNVTCLANGALASSFTCDGNGSWVGAPLTCPSLPALCNLTVLTEGLPPSTGIPDCSCLDAAPPLCNSSGCFYYPNSICNVYCTAPGSTNTYGSFFCDSHGNWLGGPLTCAGPPVCNLTDLATQIRTQFGNYISVAVLSYNPLVGDLQLAGTVAESICPANGTATFNSTCGFDGVWQICASACPTPPPPPPFCPPRRCCCRMT